MASTRSRSVNFFFSEVSSSRPGALTESSRTSPSCSSAASTAFFGSRTAKLLPHFLTSVFIVDTLYLHSSIFCKSVRGEGQNRQRMNVDALVLLARCALPSQHEYSAQDQGRRGCRSHRRIDVHQEFVIANEAHFPKIPLSLPQ